MEDKNLSKPTDNNSPINLMNFESPIPTATFLIPDRSECIKNSPLLTVQNEIVSNISPDPTNTIPLAASTPFINTHAPNYFLYTSPKPINAAQEVSDPFELMEQQVNDLANDDPFEMVAKEAAKTLPDLPTSPADVDLLDTTYSLNKGFREDSSENKSSGSNNNTMEELMSTNKETTKPTTEKGSELDKDETWLENTVPPWEDGTVSDSEDEAENLQDVIGQASLELMSSIASSPAEMLDQENVHGLRLTAPHHMPRYFLDESLPLDLEMPPMSLDTTVLSSPSPGHSPFEGSKMVEEKVDFKLKAKKLPTPIITKPLRVITNSPAIINPPAKVTNLPKLPSRLASRLLQPKVFKKQDA